MAGPELVRFVPLGQVALHADMLFRRHRDVIARVLPLAGVEHVGATALPAGLTKGDVDLCVLVEADVFPAADAALAGLYRRNTGSDRSSTFSAFEDAREPVGVQLCARGGPEDTFVIIRDLLRARPDVLAAYDGLKRRHDGGPMDAYRSEKAAFMEALVHLVRTGGSAAAGASKEIPKI